MSEEKYITKTTNKWIVKLIKMPPKRSPYKVSKTSGEKYFDINGNFSKFSHKTWRYDSKDEATPNSIYDWGCLEDYVELVKIKVLLKICIFP